MWQKYFERDLKCKNHKTQDLTEVSNIGEQSLSMSIIIFHASVGTCNAFLEEWRFHRWEILKGAQQAALIPVASATYVPSSQMQIPYW